MAAVERLDRGILRAILNRDVVGQPDFVVVRVLPHAV